VKDIKALLEPDEVRGLLSRLCIEYGFCLPPIEIEKLAVSPPTDIDKFTEAALVALRLSPHQITWPCNGFRRIVSTLAKSPFEEVVSDPGQASARVPTRHAESVRHVNN
jgi:hypothetical protein